LTSIQEGTHASKWRSCNEIGQTVVGGNQYLRGDASVRPLKAGDVAPDFKAPTSCRSKFAVAADKDQNIMKSYDALLAIKPEYADRVSYVIAPDGHVVFAYKSLNPGKHVEYTLDALRKWYAQQGR
jgi:hypothetical protein